MNTPESETSHAAARLALAQVAAEALRVDPRRRGTARLANAINDAVAPEADVVIVKSKESEAV